VPIVKLMVREAQLRRRVRAHLKKLGFGRGPNGDLVPPRLDKAGYRELHAPQRAERLAEEAKFLQGQQADLITHFASGSEVNVQSMRIRVELIDHSSWQSDLFRFATLLWSIPVSKGFGRRMRFLVWDDHTEKLVGVFALGDPVFNLGARDRLIGWTAKDRGSRLVHMLDGYVIGAVPPYNRILGGKLVASLMRTQEVVAAFRARYGSSEGIISGSSKNAHLVAITTTSALGRSAIYNRLRLDGISYLESIGFTGGYGHFHFPRALFDEMRDYLEYRKDPYANNHQYGDGPNWRLRSIRRALHLLGMNPDLLKHGLAREVFVSHLADNAVDVLSGRRKRPKYGSLLTAANVAQLAISRWMLPRALRDESYRQVTREEILAQVTAVAPRRASERDPKIAQRNR
jgi:Domain of unknown function (DUF4338)